MDFIGTFRRSNKTCSEVANLQHRESDGAEIFNRVEGYSRVGQALAGKREKS